MRALKYYIALSSCALALAGCSSSTGLGDCNYSSTNASFISSFAPLGVGVTAEITSVRYSSGEHSPGGGPASQLDVMLTVVESPHDPLPHLEGPPAGTKLHAVVGGLTPVFSARGSEAPSATSACSLAIGEKVNAWLPLSDQFGSGFGDFVNPPPPPDLSSISFEAIQIEILRGA